MKKEEVTICFFSLPQEERAAISGIRSTLMAARQLVNTEAAEEEADAGSSRGSTHSDGE